MILFGVIVLLVFVLAGVAYTYWEKCKDYDELLKERDGYRTAFYSLEGGVVDVWTELANYYDFIEVRKNRNLKFRKIDVKRLKLIVEDLRKLFEGGK